MTTTTTTAGIETIEGPEVIPANVTEQHLVSAGLRSQGVFFLGPQCVKKYPKHFRKKY